jgi:hypothetical protein
MAIASSVASGAMMTSVKMSVIARAASASSVRLSATMPPKADVVSQASALRYAATRLSPSATPHGLACLMMAQAAVRAGSNSATHSKAASVSLMLL